MITAGLTCQMISWAAMMSWGYWMIGRPSHEKLYEYLYSALLRNMSWASAASSRSAAMRAICARSFGPDIVIGRVPRFQGGLEGHRPSKNLCLGGWLAAKPPASRPSGRFRGGYGSPN